MQGKVRYHRIQLIPYYLVDTQFWSLPLIGPTPPSYVLSKENIVPFPYNPRRLPRKIHLLSMRQSGWKGAPASPRI
jgi:hypothetical protein